MGKYFQQDVHLPVYTDTHPIMHTVAPPAAYARIVPHFDDRHQMYNITESKIGGDEVRYEDSREMKEGTQTLEKKFRAMEVSYPKIFPIFFNFSWLIILFICLLFLFWSCTHQHLHMETNLDQMFDDNEFN